MRLGLWWGLRFIEGFSNDAWALTIRRSEGRRADLFTRRNNHTDETLLQIVIGEVLFGIPLIRCTFLFFFFTQTIHSNIPQKIR